MLRVLDLFSGIGGFSLGLERTGGFRTVAFCEIEPYCRAVLRKHWPDVPCFEDVRTLTAAQVGAADVICGGFPCQDISTAGKGAGIGGERSGLWREYARLIGEVRPCFVIVENVSALLGRGLGDVLGDLAEIGYDAEWHCIPASAVGAPHRRDRIWIVANPGGRRLSGSSGGKIQQPWRAEVVSTGQDVAYPYQPRLQGWLGAILRECAGEWTARSSSPFTPLADSTINGRKPRRPGNAAEISGGWQPDRSGIGQDDVAHPASGGEQRGGARSDVGNVEKEILRSSWYPHDWNSEPDVGRVANGVPSRVDRLRALGNAVVPQIPEIIGRAILQAEGIQ